MSTVAKQLRSSFGFESPYFIVDSSGNLVTQTITVTGNRIELTAGSYLSYNGNPLLTQTSLGSSVTNIPGILTGLAVGTALHPASITLHGNLNVTDGGSLVSIINPTTTGSVDNMIIGANVPVNGTFTNLTVTNSISLTSNSITLSPAHTLTLGTPLENTNFLGNIIALGTQNITLTPTSTGLITISPVTTGTMDNMAIGQTTPAAGNFTTSLQTVPNEQWNTPLIRNYTATKRYAENTGVLMAFFAMGQ